MAVYAPAQILQPAVEIREEAEPVNVEWETIDMNTNRFVEGLRSAHAGGSRQIAGGVFDPLTGEIQGELTLAAMLLLLVGGGVYAYMKFRRQR